MKLNDIFTGNYNAADWESKAYQLPKFDIQAVRRKTHDEPTWVHFGGGNIFRAFPAAILNDALNTGKYDRGVIVAETFDYEVIDKAYTPYNNLSLLVSLQSTGTIEKKVIASVTEALKADPQFDDWKRLVEIFQNPSLQMISFTITEKGYTFNEADLARGMSPVFAMGKVTALLYERFLAGALPLTVQSMDNCSHNGTKLENAVLAFAQKWVDNGFADKGFSAYLTDPAKVSFTWSMIDKITPRPDAGVKTMLEQAGFEDTESVITSKKTYVAPFVNSEQAQYLVIEDRFPNGRPPLDKAGVIFTDRETVDKVEKMKVCTCLNPLHTALAVFGCLLGYKKICDEMKDPDLEALVKGIGYREGLPVVVDPGIISPKAFIDEVIGVRFPNPFMPDTPQRIATDTSQKLSIRYGETIKAYLASGSLDINSLELIPLTLAGWLRYLTGIGDDGEAFAVSPDPMYESLKKQLGGLSLGDKGPFDEILRPILSSETIFAVDLYKAGLAKKVEDDFGLLMAGPGAVRKTLHSFVSKN